MLEQSTWTLPEFVGAAKLMLKLQQPQSFFGGPVTVQCCVP